MHDAFIDSAGARGIDTIDSSLVRGPLHGLATGRAVHGKIEGAFAPISACSEWAEDLRNHLSGPNDLDPISNPDILGTHHVLIVERCTRDGDAAQLNGFEDCPRIERPGASHVDLHIEQACDGDLGCELPCDRPAGLATTYDAEIVLEISGVDLDDDAVGRKRQRRQQGLDFDDALPDVIEVRMEAMM
jgi:hypothetical protein